MKSTAHIKGHPIHPILVVFPVAFFTGTLIFDVLGVICASDSFWQTGKYLEIAGIIGGLIAAIPGAIDYFFTIPPQSSGKSRGAKHALLNISMVVIFAIAAILRDTKDDNAALTIGLEIAGEILLCIAGWMGGTLVYRNMIGVYNRYANAGKWDEQYIHSASGKIEVASADELKTDQVKLVHVKDKRIVIGKTEDGYVAFDDHCTHKGGSLAGGTVICGTVQCPWHGSQFDLKTGAVKAGPAKKGINVYPISEEDGKIYIKL